MKILLIYPLTRTQRIPAPSWTPLGLSSIAAVLQRGGHQVRIFDRFSQMARLGLRTERVNAAMLRLIREFQPDVVGLNTVSPLVYDSVQCARLIRPGFKGLLVAGGHHATALPESTLRKIPELDGVIQGEGEFSLLQLLDGDRPQTIPGTWWRNKDDHISRVPARQIADLDTLPFPDFNLLDMAFYTRRSVIPIRGYCLSSIALMTSRGCDKKCEFCTETLTYGKGVRFHSADYVLEWIRQVVKQYGVEGVYFHDNDFLADRERAIRICEGIMTDGLHRTVKWAVQARSDRLDREIVGLLKRAGCVLIETGIEAASQKELNVIRKMNTVSVNERAIEICRDLGMAVHAYMLTGFEGETLADLQNRLDWIKKLRPTSFTWAPIQIYPASALYRGKQMNFFETSDWTAENVITYFRQDHLSPIPAARRRTWMRRHFVPFARRYRQLNILRRNRWYKLALLLIDDLYRFLRTVQARRGLFPSV